MTDEELFYKLFPDGIVHYGQWFYCPYCEEIYHEVHFCTVKNRLIAPDLEIGVEKNDDNTGESA